MTEYSSLNLALTDGRSFVATRVRTNPCEEPPSLFYQVLPCSLLFVQWCLLFG